MLFFPEISGHGKVASVFLPTFIVFTSIAIKK